jgi:hypothetical protein
MGAFRGTWVLTRSVVIEQNQVINGLIQIPPAPPHKKMGQGLLKNFPRRRLCEMDSLSVALLHLYSDHARGVTGSVFAFDDGQSL